ncbi:hypothetical protein KIN20_017614 [Parelaphostrongylus tenuis]|uniref:Uncharacterized protein n=1 Tax=Parelaphostrongylus tenuis TaxID=148309 RepID=A0AAD5QRL3_PARTN|nr:hypothetical protein KIN20_017614 [Parelaphostrongylus tenuis]
MSLFEDEKKLDKRAKSEAQRVESIRAKKVLEQQRQAILSQALRDIDQRKGKRLSSRTAMTRRKIPLLRMHGRHRFPLHK